MRKQFLEELGEHPTPVAVMSGVGAAVCGIGLSQSWGHWAALVWTLGIAGFVALPALNTRRNRLQQSHKAAQACIKNVLAACAAAYGDPDRHVRTNIMLVQNGRRRVDAETAFNMGSDSDCDLEIDESAGVSGEAFVQRATTYGDLALLLQPGGPTWGLRPAELAKVRRDLKSILSVPIFDPDAPEKQPVGTLQVDSDLTFEHMEFDKPERREVAERFADVVALLLKTGR